MEYFSQVLVGSGTVRILLTRLQPNRRGYMSFNNLVEGWKGGVVFMWYNTAKWLNDLGSIPVSESLDIPHM